MRTPTFAVLTAALAVGLSGASAALPAGAAPAPTQEPPAADDPEALELLSRTFDGPSRPINGTLAVVVIDEQGPFVSELQVTSNLDGEIVVGRSRSFWVGRNGDEAFLLRDGTLLRLGGVVSDEQQLSALVANYTVRPVPATELDTGPADGVDLLDARGVRRERLWIDHRSGAVVRRETYDREGRIRRLLAFTEVTILASGLTDTRVTSSESSLTSGPISELDEAALRTLAKTGWQVPDELPGGFRLLRGFALDNGGDHSSLHLLYSDGLYALSLYEQPGIVAPAAVRDAVWLEDDGIGVWRWPGAQPERLVWTADGMTYTMVADATSDHLLASLAALPRGQRDDPGSRFRRGLARVGSWFNPFG